MNFPPFFSRKGWGGHLPQDVVSKESSFPSLSSLPAVHLLLSPPPSFRHLLLFSLPPSFSSSFFPREVKGHEIGRTAGGGGEERERAAFSRSLSLSCFLAPLLYKTCTRKERRSRRRSLVALGALKREEKKEGRKERKKESFLYRSKQERKFWKRPCLVWQFFCTTKKKRRRRRREKKREESSNIRLLSQFLKNSKFWRHPRTDQSSVKKKRERKRAIWVLALVTQGKIRLPGERGKVR